MSILSCFGTIWQGYRLNYVIMCFIYCRAVTETEAKLPELEKNLIKAQKDLQKVVQKEAACTEAVSIAWKMFFYTEADSCLY